MFLLLRLLILTLAGLTLVISTQHHYSAQIYFDMHEFKLFHFSHALISCVWYQMKEEKIPLYNEAYSLIKSCVAMKITY